jgi:signal transduction histidine kinase
LPSFEVKKNKPSSLWIFDVIYPLLLSIILFSGVTYLFYTGQKHRRLSSQMEERLIHLSLSLASPRVLPTPSSMATVTLNDRDIQFFEQTQKIPDHALHVEMYTQLLEALLQAGSKNIIVYFLPLGRNLDEASYEPLIQLAEKAKAQQRLILFATNPSLIKYMPKNVRHALNLFEADPCQEGVQLMCVYNKEWNLWLIQILYNIFVEHQEDDKVTSNLPRLRSSYLLYLNKPADFIDSSFIDVIHHPQQAAKYAGKTVFVGAQLLPSHLENTLQPYFTAELLSVKTPLNSGINSFSKKRTPLHTFWAQAAQFFYDDAFIYVYPHAASLLLALLWAILIMLVIFYQGVQLALGLIVLYNLIGPVINSLFISYGHFYLPLFDSFYAGLSTFLVWSFLKLSHESFHSTRLSLKHKEQEDLSDMKGNFLSLMSHNLNTPIAKMRGLFDLLRMLHNEEWASLTQAEKDLAQIHLIVKFVLVTLILEEQRLNTGSLTLKSIQEEFKNSSLPVLKRLGYQCQYLDLKSDENATIPLVFDKRTLHAGMLALLVILGHSLEKKNIFIDLRVESLDDEDPELILAIQSKEWESIDLAKVLEKQKTSFLEEVSAQLLNLFCQIYQARLTKEQNTVLLKVGSLETKLAEFSG